MKTENILFSLILSALLTGCSETGKATAYQALRHQAKYDCELSSVNDCPRGPGNYTEYRDERAQLLRKEGEVPDQEQK